jgi:membrane glycosyltransferase
MAGQAKLSKRQCSLRRTWLCHMIITITIHEYLVMVMILAYSSKFLVVELFHVFFSFATLFHQED